MSHDQKPGRMRVVSNAAAAPQRRRDDGAEPAAVTAASAASPAGAPALAAPQGKPVKLLVLLFIAGCAVGGAALPLLGWW